MTQPENLKRSQQFSKSHNHSKLTWIIATEISFQTITPKVIESRPIIGHLIKTYPSTITLIPIPIIKRSSRNR